MYTAALFDLDGTLTASGEGIVKSVQYALAKLGKPAPDLEELRVFIGPPLLEQFMTYANLSKEEGNRAVAYYRERYSEIGIFENRPYNGIKEALQCISNAGIRLAVASSKPENFVNQVLDHFNLTQYFEVIAGATLDGTRSAKADVIEEALGRLGLEDARDQVIMVGDKEHDVFGARQEGLSCIAVSYGYGTKEELEAAKPAAIVDSPTALATLLTQGA